MDIKGSSHSSDVYYNQNLEYGALLQDVNANIPDPWSATNRNAWDREAMRQCLCDSSWAVGFESGQRQLSEWFGPDCSLKRCPSGDDPYVVR
jgi:hypothetical protein